MKTISKTVLLSVLVIVLASCSSFAPKATGTPIPTQTSLPTSTSILEPTKAPTQTPTATPVLATETPSAPVLRMPTGKPAKEWEGIPIMPNAIAGEGDSTGYSFTVNASVDDVQKFYETKLTKLGWSTFASGQGTTDAVMLIFMKGTDVMSLSIVPQPDGSMCVLLVK